MADFSIGVDLGGTNLRIAAVERDGTLLEKINRSTRTSLGRDYVIEEMCAAIGQLAAKHRQAGDLLGIGVGVPGIVDTRTGLLHEAPNLPGWSETHVGNEIERRLGTRVVVENDANAAALGEAWLGAGGNAADLAIFTLGTGVGGGIVLGGKIWHGMSGIAGEFGHIIVDPEGVPCTCGSRGCLEQYASIVGIMRIANEMVASGQVPKLSAAIRSGQEFSPKMIYKLALAGDEASRQIFHTVGRVLGIAIATMVNILNLPLHVIGGGVSNAWDAFAPAMFEELRRCAVTARDSQSQFDTSEPEERQTTVVRATLGSDAGLYGAAKLSLLPG
jgi:glucokinase